MNVTFSIRKALISSFHTIFAQPRFFLFLGLISLILSICSSFDIEIISILAVIASVLWSYVHTNVMLSSVDGKKEFFSVKKISHFFPHMREVWQYIGLVVLLIVIVSVGFLLLIVPGIYLSIRLMFAKQAYIDHKAGILDAIRYSWNISKGSIFWTLLLVEIVSALLFVVGIFAGFIIGLIVVFPLVALLQTMLYRLLTTTYNASHAIEVQPLEIVSTEPASTEHSSSE